MTSEPPLFTLQTDKTSKQHSKLLLERKKRVVSCTTSSSFLERYLTTTVKNKHILFGPATQLPEISVKQIQLYIMFCICIFSLGTILSNPFQVRVLKILLKKLHYVVLCEMYQQLPTK